MTCWSGFNSDWLSSTRHLELHWLLRTMLTSLPSWNALLKSN